MHLRMHVFQLVILGAIYAVSCVNWSGDCHECRERVSNKCRNSSRDLSVNTLTHGKPHCIDMETRHVLVADSDKEMNNNNNGAETQYSACPELQAPAPISEQGQSCSDSRSRVGRPLPRNTYPHETESGFVTQVGFLGSKTGQLERSLAPGSQSSPAARLARHTQQQQQGSCSAVTASPFIEDRERSLFSVDKNPYTSPVITNNIGMGRNAGNFPTGLSQTQGVGEKNSSWSTADRPSVTVLMIILMNVTPMEILVWIIMHFHAVRTRMIHWPAMLNI